MAAQCWMPLPSLALARQLNTGPLCPLLLCGIAPLRFSRSRSQKPGGAELEGRAGLVHHFLGPETHAHSLVRDLARKLHFLLVAGDSGRARRSRLGKEEDGVLNRSL